MWKIEKSGSVGQRLLTSNNWEESEDEKGDSLNKIIIIK